MEAKIEFNCLTGLIYRLYNFTQGTSEKTAEWDLAKKSQNWIFIVQKMWLQQIDKSNMYFS